MQFKLSLDLDNAAFAENRNGELAAALRMIADRIKNGDEDFTVRDLNGNHIGHVLVLEGDA